MNEIDRRLRIAGLRAALWMSVVSVAALVAVGVVAFAGRALASGDPVPRNLAIVGGHGGVTATWDHPVDGLGATRWVYAAAFRPEDAKHHLDSGGGTDAYRASFGRIPAGTEVCISVIARALDGDSGEQTGIPVTRCGSTLPDAPAAATAAPVTASPTPAQVVAQPEPSRAPTAAPAAAPTKATPTCVRRTVATRTTGTGTRANRKVLRIQGRVTYWTPRGWRAAPAGTRLVVQRRVGTAWRPVATIAAARPSLVTAPRGVYRLSFTASCSSPAASSVSTPIAA